MLRVSKPSWPFAIPASAEERALATLGDSWPLRLPPNRRRKESHSHLSLHLLTPPTLAQMDIRVPRLCALPTA